MGGLRRRRAAGGYVLLDVLTAMAIAVAGLAVFFSGLAAVARVVSTQEKRVLLSIEKRNGDAKSQAIFFQGE